MFVVDTSIAMAWCFEDEATQATDAVLNRLRDDHAVVPAIWPLEVANVLLVAERRGRLSEAQASRFLELLAQLPINVDDSPTDMAGIVATGRRHTLSSYDASYLQLAERLGAALATLDKTLAKAASKAGVQLLVKA
jgi:predicted nucleic acid-binding protein